MWLFTIGPLLIAVAAGHLAWHHATRFDRLSAEGNPKSPAGEERRSWRFVLVALLIASAAVGVLQLVLLA